MTPYYDEAGITIYHGDCREVLPTIGFADLALLAFDPPYGISHETSHGASWEGTKIANDDSTELREWVLKQFAWLPAIVFGTWKVGKPERTRQTLIWNKGPAFGMGDLSFPWKNSFEEIYIIGEGWKGRRDEGVLTGHIVPSWESRGRRHPHEKPVSLWQCLIAKSPDGKVIDPCTGTGSALQAAKLEGRTAIGIEIEERYCEIAANRLRQGVLFGAAS